MSILRDSYAKLDGSHIARVKRLEIALYDLRGEAIGDVKHDLFRLDIGRSTAIRLARDFSSIVLAARDRPNLEKTADAVKTAGAEPLIIDTDLSETAAAKTVVDQTLSAFGRTT